jgi:hypothetical protein
MGSWNPSTQEGIESIPLHLCTLTATYEYSSPQPANATSKDAQLCRVARNSTVFSKEGDAYLRTLLVQGAHHILGPFGADSDLPRWGLKLAERGGKNGKKRAVIATARKLAVLLHRLWMSGEAYEALRNRRLVRLPVAA